MLGALIGGAFSLINGAANRSAKRRANEANRPINQVAEWEAAGINPLFGISSGGYIPHAAESFGDAFSVAGQHFQEYLDAKKNPDKVKETETRQENTQLKKQLDKLAKPVEKTHLAKHGGALPLPEVRDAGEDNGTVFGDLPVPFVSDVGLQHSGVDPDAAVRGSVPYVGSRGNAIVGPNPETQMGIDEVAGWLAMEGAALSSEFYNQTKQNVQRLSQPAFDKLRRYIGNKRWDDARAFYEAERARLARGAQWGASLPRSIAPTQREIDRHVMRQSALGL